MKTNILLTMIALAISNVASADDFAGLNTGTNPLVLKAAHNLGAKWVRTHLSWSTVQPSAKLYNWKPVDSLLDDAAKYNLAVFITVDAISPWASTKLPDNWGNSQDRYFATYPPNDYSEYATFIRALVTHCRGREVVWQIENEVNSKAFWGGTRDEYIHLLQTAYKAAHEASPKCTIIPAGLAQIFPHTDHVDMRMKRTREWFDSILDSHTFDAVDVHDYLLPESDPMWKTWGMSFEQYLKKYREWMQAKGVSVPIWISECGVNSAPVQANGTTYNFSPQQQADDMRAIYTSAKSLKVAHVLWYPLRDRDEGVFSHMGLGSKDGTKKPSSVIFQQIATRK